MLHNKILGDIGEESVLSNIINSFHHSGKILHHPVMADIYLNNLNNQDSKKSVLSFLEVKNSENPENIKLFDSKYKQVFIFDDNSILVQKSNDDYQILSTSDDIFSFQEELFKEMIKDEFKKRPMTMKELIGITYSATGSCITERSVDRSQADSFRDAIHFYKENLDILRLNDFHFADTYLQMENRNSPVNSLNKLMNDIVTDHKVKQYATSISSQKYASLYDDESYAIVKKICEANISLADYRTEIGRHMATYKTPEDFNNALNAFYIHHQGFTAEQTIAKAVQLGADVVASVNDVVVLKINTFEQSNELGSDLWAISKVKDYFDYYTADNKEQYFVFDYKKDFSDPASLIGITMEKGQPFAAHYKDCDSIERDDSSLNKYVYLINEAANNVIYSPSNTALKADIVGAEVLKSNDGLVVVKINNFEQSKALGSDSWHISTNKEFFERYVDSNRDAYFVIDHTKNIKDPYSLVSLVMKDNKIVFGYDKTHQLLDPFEEPTISLIDIVNKAKVDSIQNPKNNDVKNKLTM